MANPQREDGHTRIANEIMEALGHIRIPGEAVQVLWVILRQTYGWNKKTDAISLSQFMKKTGLLRQHVADNIKKLIKMNIITEKGYAVTEKGNELGKVYEFNKNYDKWTPLPKKVTRALNTVTPAPKKVTPSTPAPNTVQIGTEYGANPSPNTVHTKAIKTKRNVGGEKKPPTMIPSFFPVTAYKDRPELVIPYLEERKTFVKQQSDPYRLANFLFWQIIENNNKSRFTGLSHANKEKTIERWSRDIELLLRKDLAHLNGNTVDVVGEVIEWATQHTFWSSNILSGAKLRGKWDSLTKQMSKEDSKEDI
jgi:phage replication O-like protein O